jgi:hypothetical protein
MGFLKDALKIERGESVFNTEAEIPGLSMVTGEDVIGISTDKDLKAKPRPALHRIEAAHFTFHTQPPWRGVTGTADIRRQHGKAWTVLGDILHRLFEGVSKGLIKEEDVHKRAEAHLDSSGFRHEEKDEKLGLIIQQVATLKKHGVWEEIIMPKKDSFAELPFICETGDSVFNGRIDRVIKKGGMYNVYDYKTFPVKEQDIDYLVKEYAFQLTIYKKAVRELFNTDDVKSFIIFTHTGDIKECKTQM